MLYWISAELDVRPTYPGVQTSVGHLHGSFLVLDSLLQQLDVLLHVENLLEDLQLANSIFVQIRNETWAYMRMEVGT